MSYDSKQGLYYDFFINKVQQDFNPSYLTNLEFHHSIFELFPKITFSLINRDNLFYQTGLANIKNEFVIELGTQANDENSEIIKDFVVEKNQLTEAKSDFSGELLMKLVNKSQQDLVATSEAKAWEDKLTSDVISDIITPYFEESEIEATKTKGIWIKPDNQSESEFLKILKNRSLSNKFSASKMFMWIDLAGKFHFESINSMISKKPTVSFDFTDSESEVFAATDFDYIDNGSRYNPQDLGSPFKEYKFGVETGELIKLPEPDVSNLDGSDSENISDIEEKTVSSPVFQGFTHSKICPEYNQALYTNDTYNFPYRLSFRCRNVPEIQPGSLIWAIFPHNDKLELYDTSLSGKYLVVDVRKLESGNQLVNEVFIVSNSQLQQIEALKQR